MRRLIVAVLVAFGMALGVVETYAKEKSGPEARAEAFLTSLNSGSVGPAYDTLFAGSPLPAMKPQALDVLKRQTEAALPVYGAALGVEHAGTTMVSESVAIVTYVQKFEQLPLTWRFWFYRPTKDWVALQVLFNDNFSFLTVCK